MENHKNKVIIKATTGPYQATNVLQNPLSVIVSCDDSKALPPFSHHTDTLILATDAKENIAVDSSDGHEDCHMNANKETKIHPINKVKIRPTKCQRTYKDISKLDENVREVAIRLEKGCECQEQNCFDGFDAEGVYKHRLNIDELSKLEHDMYLMGITMACMESPDETNRHKERKRLRAKYRFKVRNKNHTSLFC